LVGFQSSQWAAIQATNTGTPPTTRRTSIDLAVFIVWLEATTDGEDETAEFIYEGMPDRLRVATDAWLAEDPFENPDAATSPFVMEAYVVPAAQIADDLAQSAEEYTMATQQATERATEYVLTTVLSATVLFFASISSKLNGEANRWAILSVAVIGLVAGAVILVAFPRAPTA
jgi:hypothetical protein